MFISVRIVVVIIELFLEWFRLSHLILSIQSYFVFHIFYSCGYWKANIIIIIIIIIINSAISYAFKTLGYDRPTLEQERAIREFVSGRDIFVISPTGSGKSLCFVALPLVFDHIRRRVSRNVPHLSILLVICPLTALMKDQVSKYGSVVSCTYIGETFCSHYKFDWSR